MEINFTHLQNKGGEHRLVYTVYLKDKTHQTAAAPSPSFSGLMKIIKPMFSSVAAKTLVDQANLWEATLKLKTEFKLRITLFEPPRETKDMFGLQFIVKQSGAAKDCWKAMRHLLKYYLKHIEQVLAAGQLAVIGCTTAYLSACHQQVAAKPRLSRLVLDAALPVFGTNHTANLATHETPEGNLWLVQRPMEPGLLSNLIYVGFAQPGKQDTFFESYFDTLKGKVNYFDIYVHKAAYQWLQIKNQNFADFDHDVKGLSTDTRFVLNNIHIFRLGDMQNHIEAIAVRMAKIMGQHAEYARLGLSVQFQKRNFEILYNPEKITPGRQNEIWDFHHASIADQADGFELLLHRCDIIIDQTKTAITLIEASQAKLSSERTGYLQVYVAIVGIALTYIQLFTNAMALDILKVLGLAAADTTLLKISPWLILLTRVSIFILILLILRVAHRIYNKQKAAATISKFKVA